MNCATNSPAHVTANDYCHTFTYTPDQAVPTLASVSWSRQFDPNYLHPPVCLQDGATYVTFWARAEGSQAQVAFSAQGTTTVTITLTTTWTQYQIPTTGVKYNTDESGLEVGFKWSVQPQLSTLKFSIDHIVWVKTGA